jgi:hypothetical protein
MVDLVPGLGGSRFLHSGGLQDAQGFYNVVAQNLLVDRASFASGVKLTLSGIVEFFVFEVVGLEHKTFGLFVVSDTAAHLQLLNFLLLNQLGRLDHLEGLCQLGFQLVLRFALNHTNLLDY